MNHVLQGGFVSEIMRRNKIMKIRNACRDLVPLHPRPRLTIWKDTCNVSTYLQTLLIADASVMELDPYN